MKSGSSIGPICGGGMRIPNFMEISSSDRTSARGRGRDRTPRSPSEIARVSQRSAASGIAVAAEEGGRPTRRMEAGNTQTVGREHLPVEPGPQTPEREPRPDGVLDPAVDQGERRRDEGPEELGTFVEEGILTLGRVAVVELHRGDQDSFRESGLPLQLLDRLRDPGGLHPDHSAAEGGLVEQEIDPTLLMEEALDPDVAVIGVFVDESLAGAVQVDAPR